MNIVGILGIYLVIINIVAFVFYGIDKKRAVKEERRISEKQLLQLAAAGGVFGSMMGMEIFKHKRVKGSFQIKFRGILMLRVALLVFIAMKNQ